MNLCNCGSIADAIKVAEKLYVDTAASDCPVWALTVATAFRTICIEASVDEQIKRKEVEVIVNAIVKETRKRMQPVADLTAQSVVKGAKLNG